MSLATRVSAFFLTALAVVLIGLSVTLYTLASGYLHRKTDRRINTALDILEASVDVEPDGLEWEPRDRRITIGTDPGPENVRWAVADGSGNRLDQSGNATADFPVRWRPTAWSANPPDATVFGHAPGWRMGARRLVLEDLLRYGRGHPEDDPIEDDIEYPVLVLVAGVAPDGALASLRLLAISLGGLSTALWLCCALVGRWFCRRALEPLAEMAGAARRMTAATLEERLPIPQTRDELASLGEAFNALLDRLAEARDRQGRFAGDASHQLRTPLTGMLTLLDVVRRRQRTVPEYAEAIEKMHEETVRMQQIVESLLFLSRDAAQVMEVQCEPIALDEWLARHLESWRTHPRAADIQLEQAASPSIVVLGQSALLGQLVDILLENACKFSEAQTPITIDTLRKGNLAGVVVYDRGAGIAADDLPHLFEPFFRSTTARRSGRSGVGLGLAIAQRIATVLHGHIEVSSVPGLGARFEVLLPQGLSASPQHAPTSVAAM